MSSLERVDITVVDSIPVTTCTRNLIDLAGVLPPATLENALDEALRRRLTTLRHLRSRIEHLGARGRSGMGALLTLIEERRRSGLRSESDLETKFFRLLRSARIPLPVSQHELHVGGRLLRPDFVYPDLRVAIELDGYRWHSGRTRWKRDLARGSILMALGWRLFRFTDEDIDRRPDEVCKMIADVLDRGDGSGSNPHP